MDKLLEIEIKRGKRLVPQAKYSPDQPRDDHGRFGEGNGSDGGGATDVPNTSHGLESINRSVKSISSSFEEMKNLRYRLNENLKTVVSVRRDLKFDLADIPRNVDTAMTSSVLGASNAVETGDLIKGLGDGSKVSDRDIAKIDRSFERAKNNLSQAEIDHGAVATNVKAILVRPENAGSHLLSLDDVLKHAEQLHAEAKNQVTSFNEAQKSWADLKATLTPVKR